MLHLAISFSYPFTYKHDFSETVESDSDDDWDFEGYRIAERKTLPQLFGLLDGLVDYGNQPDIDIPGQQDHHDDDDDDQNQRRNRSSTLSSLSNHRTSEFETPPPQPGPQRRHVDRPATYTRSGRPSRRPLTFGAEFGYAAQEQISGYLFDVLEARSYGIPPFIKLIHEALVLVTNKDPSTPNDPITITEATSDPTYGEQWKRAIEDELVAFFENKAWEYTVKPKDRKTVKPKWILTYKLGPSNEVERCKARLVAKGYTQKEGIDYSETFAAVAKMDSIRFLFSIAVTNDLLIHQMDVKNAFLNAEIDHEIYLALPEGLAIPQEELAKLKEKEELVFRLKKSMYGLKQASCNWYKKLESKLVQLGMTRMESDHAVYLKIDTGLIVAFWVDDILLLHKSKDELQIFKDILAGEFQMKDMGELSFFLKMKITRDKNRLFISQEHYIERVIQQYMDKTNLKIYGADIPMKPSQILEPNKEKFPHQQKIYQKYIGSLMYAMLGTRPDIAYAVNKLAQFASNPSIEHHRALTQVMRYLIKTKNYGLLMTKEWRQPSEGVAQATLDYFTKYRESPKVIGMSDADFAASHDRHSIGGSLFFHNGNLISWSSKKLQLIAMSTQEAEYSAMSLAARQAIWLRNFYAEIHGLNIDDIAPIAQLCDNRSAIKVALNPEDHARTKHYKENKKG